MFSVRLLRLHANLPVPSCGQDSRSAAFASFAGRHPGAAFPAPELSSLLRSSLVLTRTFTTPVALLLFCPVVAMLHPLHSPLASGANPFALFLGAGKWRFFEAYSPASGFITGKSCTSRMVVESVMSITRRSIPMPMPPVGGRPISSALT